MPDATTPEAPSRLVAVLQSLPRAPALPEGATEPGEWPGVEDPDALRTLVAQWLAGYGSAQTRRTYAAQVGSGQALVDVDPLGFDADRGEGVALGGEVCASVEQRA